MIRIYFQIQWSLLSIVPINQISSHLSNAGTIYMQNLAPKFSSNFRPFSVIVKKKKKKKSKVTLDFDFLGNSRYCNLLASFNFLQIFKET